MPDTILDVEEFKAAIRRRYADDPLSVSTDELERRLQETFREVQIVADYVEQMSLVIRELGNPDPHPDYVATGHYNLERLHLFCQKLLLDLPHVFVSKPQHAQDAM